MQLKLEKTGSRAIVYDANRISQPDASLFEPDFWYRSGSVVGKAVGRGNALMLDTPFGPAVLRRYLRGGGAAKFSRDRYLFLGYSRSRPITEATITARLFALGLPVPEVLGGICQRHGLSYSGALLTQRIANVTPLADVLVSGDSGDGMWQRIGHCIRRFHDAGVCHADLNVRNILVDNRNTIWLIDFDRARFLAPNSRKLTNNLQRLLRSLRKQKQLPDAQLDNFWRHLMLGYNSNQRPV
ncbi:MAG: 3-deoxy-D-manno-octulosonic acid kinase [Xanthomonadales bacterium]|nr:3-deoxy-D-manno-octulosonic acid kinase [Xanthomonadales bacterium]